MGVVTGPGILKFTSIMFYAVILLVVAAGIIQGVLVYNKTGETTMLIDSTLGQVVYWDGNIYIAMTQLMNQDVLSGMPEEFRESFSMNVARQVIFPYMMLFVFVGFVLYKFGNWIAGKSQFEPTTDLIIIGLIVGFFFFSELTYGWLMDKPNLVPFRGIWTWLSNFDVWWNAFSSGMVAVPDVGAVIEASDNASIVLGGV